MAAPQLSNEPDNQKNVKRWRLGGPIHENPLWIMMSHVGDIAILSLLWFVCSLPLVTIGATSTAAMYVAHKWMAGTLTSVISGFLSAFRREIKQATLMWIPIMIGIPVVWLTRNIGANTPGALGGIITACGFVLGILLAAVFGWSVALLARFAYTPVRLLSDSFRMIAAAPLPTCGLLLAVLWPSALLRFWPEAALYVLPLAVFFGGGLSALFAAWCIRENIRRIEVRVGYDRLSEEDVE